MYLKMHVFLEGFFFNLWKGYVFPLFCSLSIISLIFVYFAFSCRSLVIIFYHVIFPQFISIFHCAEISLVFLWHLSKH